MNVENTMTIFCLAVFCFTFFSCKTFAIFQQCSYRVKEFLPTIFKKGNEEFCRLSTYSLAFSLTLPLSTCFFNVNKLTFSVVVFVIVIVFCLKYYFKSNIIKRQKFTKKYIRLYVTSSLLFSFFAVVLFRFFLKLGEQFLCAFLFAFALLPMLSPIFICFGRLVNLPYDTIKYMISKSACKRKIAKNKALIKIGITGSFAKTSVKNYLAKMLENKYRVLVTPKSFNTPLGICKTVHGGVEDYDVFIVEMGARYKNDIRELCKMVKPNVGVITGIAEQHTLTLGGIENVKKAKNRLIEALPIDGFSFFSAQTPMSTQMYIESTGQKYLIGNDSSCYVYYVDFKQFKNGISFEMVVDGKAYKTFAPLIGEHNAINICMATAVSLKLGVDIKKILSVIPMLNAVEHRAQLLTLPNGITIIDDGYNANLEGIRRTARAVDVFDGYKIAVTSGIVELGENTEKINEQVGEILSNHFDLIIPIGVNSKYLEKEVLVKGKECVRARNLIEAKDIIGKKAKSGDVVAFFNDLPDRY